jgi:hypothetical protein
MSIYNQPIAGATCPDFYSLVGGIDNTAAAYNASAAQGSAFGGGVCGSGYMSPLAFGGGTYGSGLMSPLAFGGNPYMYGGQGFDPTAAIRYDGALTGHQIRMDALATGYQLKKSQFLSNPASDVAAMADLIRQNETEKAGKYLAKLNPDQKRIFEMQYKAETGNDIRKDIRDNCDNEWGLARLFKPWRWGDKKAEDLIDMFNQV